MRFLKDILLVEIETTGPDSDKDTIIQLSALLLDKDSLLEKATFNSYVKTSLLEQIMLKHASLVGVSVDVIKKSPKAYDCIKKFTETFPESVHIAMQNTVNIAFIKNIFKKATVPFLFDPHVLDLWTLEYLYTQKTGLKKVPSVNTMLDIFKLKLKNPNNALERARFEVEVFKKIIK